MNLSATSGLHKVQPTQFGIMVTFVSQALVAELAYAYALGAYSLRIRGSNPLEGTRFYAFLDRFVVILITRVDV